MNASIARRLIRAHLRYINSTPELISLLYDMDLLPEQLKEGTHEYKQMLILTNWHHKTRRHKLKSFPLTPSP